jgi:hypothetical protein
MPVARFNHYIDGGDGSDFADGRADRDFCINCRDLREMRSAVNLRDHRAFVQQFAIAKELVGLVPHRS